jgi:hypothetical protein
VRFLLRSFGFLATFYRCRTVLAFAQSIKPTERVKPVEIRGN